MPCRALACNLTRPLVRMGGMRQPETADRENDFRDYVRRSRGSLLRTATLLASGDSHRAEDLVQTVLVRMYVAWSQIRENTRDAYARKAIVNAYLDERRRPFFRREHITAEIPDLVTDEVPQSHAESAVFRALSDLPPRMRAAVILRHLHDVSVAETAQILGCSEGTVKSQTARGLSQLRSKLSDLLRDDDPAAAGIPKSFHQGD